MPQKQAILDMGGMANVIQDTLCHGRIWYC